MATIKDVAKYSGLSVSTVSRALNNRPDISDETMRRVSDAIRALDYVPSASARAMCSRKTHIVGLTIPDITDPYFNKDAAGVEDVLIQNGYQIVYGSLARSAERMLDFLRQCREMRFDGVIITPDAWTEELIQAIRAAKIPAVALRRRPPADSGIPYVDSDHFSGARQMVDYLYSIGHRKIGHIVLNTDIGRERLRGYRWAMEQHGLTPIDVQLSMPAHRFAEAVTCGGESVKVLLRDHPDVTAVFAATDALAIGAMEFLREAGIRVPEDISVAGTNDMEYARLKCFDLTTVALGRFDMGHKAATALLKLMKGGTPPQKETLIETRLIVRSSTKPTET